MRVADVRDPVADRGRHGLLERARPGLHRRDLGAQQPHALHVGLLAAHVLGAHVDDALEAEQRAGGRGRDAVLAGAGLGDDPRLAHAAGEQALAERVVDLVRAGVQEVLALEPDRVAGRLREPRGVVERRRAPGEVARAARRARRDRPGRRARRSRRPRARPAPASASRGRTGRRRARSGARRRRSRAASLRDGDAAAGSGSVRADGGEEGLEALGVLDARARPPRRRRRRPPTGARPRCPPRRCPAVSPPERISGTGERRRPASAQSQAWPEPPRSAGARRRRAGAGRCGSARARAGRRPTATRIALMTRQPVRRRHLGAVGGALVAVQLQVGEPERVGEPRDLVERLVDEDADELGAPAQRAGDPGGHGRVGGAGRARPQDEAERPGPELDGQLGVLGARDAADLDPGHPAS